jgi:hypothetical protein
VEEASARSRRAFRFWRREVFFERDGIGRHELAGEDQMALVHEGPFELLAFLEVEGLGQRGGEVDVELLGVLPLDALEFGGITHT